MKLLFAVAVLCGLVQLSHAQGLDVSPVLLSEKRVGVVVTNTTRSRVSMRKISIVRHRDPPDGKTADTLQFNVGPFELMPGATGVLLVPGLSVNVLINWLPQKWHDLFSADDVAELSLRRRGCVSCNYQPDVWAWNLVLPFDLAYEAQLGNFPIVAVQKAYAHFWKPKEKGARPPKPS